MNSLTTSVYDLSHASRSVCSGAGLIRARRVTSRLLALVLSAGTAFVAVGTLAGARPALAAGPEAAAVASPLPIKNIALYRSGVASIERRGSVEGDQSVQLRFDTEQINDILKSMIVLDLSGTGRVNGVSYASRDPLARRLSSFGVNIADDPSLGVLLSRLRGASVTITTPDGEYSGTVVGGEVRNIAQGNATAPVATPFVTILTKQGLRSINLNTAGAIDIVDKDLAAELARALAAVAEHRADTSKAVDVRFDGDGKREVLIAYVQEAPVWKTSYRLILPTDKAKENTVNMQGWAILENTTDEDWNDVTLSLVSGQPVSFRMDLYQPLYASRPMIAVPTVPGVAPRIFEGASPLVSLGTGANMDKSGGFEARMAGKPGIPRGRAEGRESPFQDNQEDSLAPASLTEALSMGEYKFDSSATASETGEVFEYRLDYPVTIERQRSAMLPIINGELTGRRVSIYALGETGPHPMRGIEITNDSKLQLLPGPISVFDGGMYAGDSQIGHVPAGDKRLLGYAVDLDVLRTAEHKMDYTINTVKIVRGLVHTTQRVRSEHTSTITNKDTDRARTVILEPAVEEGFELTSGVKPYEVTNRVQRFSVEVPAGQTVKFPLVYERVDTSMIAVSESNIEILLAQRNSGAKISDKVMDAVRTAKQMAEEVASFNLKIGALNEERAAIDTDQARIRQNMANIDKSSELNKTYMKKLTEQETRLEAIVAEIRQNQKAQQDAQRKLNEFVNALTIE
jgi:hypothetical protein